VQTVTHLSGEKQWKKIKPNSRKIRRVLEQTEEGIARDSQPNDAPPQAEGNRKIEVNRKLNRYGKKAKEGLMHRKKRPVEPEAVFGQTKTSKQYNRFRHFGQNRVKMDFAVFAIAFNKRSFCCYAGSIFYFLL
jgi:hypothetical protein